MSMFSEGGTSYPDLLIVLILLIFCILSCTLNSHVFLYNWRRKFTVPVLLFRALAAFDLVTSVLVSAVSIVRIASAGEPKCWEERPPFPSGDNTTLFICKVDNDPGVGTRVFGMATWFAIVTPNWIIAVMAICRFLQIRFPFRPLKRRYVFATFAIFGVYIVPLIFWVCFAKNSLFVSYINNMMNVIMSSNPGLSVLIIFLPSLLGQTLAIITSLFTVRSLIRQTSVNSVSERSRMTGRKSSMKIILTNFVSVMNSVLLCLITGLTARFIANKSVRILTFMRTVVFPVVLSAVNPLIFIVLTPNFWKKENFDRSSTIRQWKFINFCRRVQDCDCENWKCFYQDFYQVQIY